MNLFVGARFLYRVAVDDFAKNFYGLVNRRAREAAVSCVRKTFAQIMSKAVCCKNSRVGRFQLCADVRLSSVRFVRKTDNIFVGRQLAEFFAEFLNRNDVDTT